MHCKPKAGRTTRWRGKKKKCCLTLGVTRKENSTPTREERHLLGHSMMLISRSKGRSCPHFHCHRTLRRHRKSVSNPNPTQLSTLLQALIKIKHEIFLSLLCSLLWFPHQSIQSLQHPPVDQHWKVMIFSFDCKTRMRKNKQKTITFFKGDVPVQ